MELIGHCISVSVAFSIMGLYLNIRDHGANSYFRKINKEHCRKNGIDLVKHSAKIKAGLQQYIEEIEDDESNRDMDINKLLGKIHLFTFIYVCTCFILLSLIHFFKPFLDALSFYLETCCVVILTLAVLYALRNLAKIDNIFEKKLDKIYSKVNKEDIQSIENCIPQALGQE